MKMTIELGENPWILIGLTFFELFLILIPALISSKIGKISFKEELNQMGFKKDVDDPLRIFFKILTGLSIGLIFYIISNFLMFFFKNLIVENLLGTSFIKEGQAGVINTEPKEPTVIQLILLIILQIIVTGPCEEGFFRGFILKKCENVMKTKYAVLISSLCFSFYHLPPVIVPMSTIITFIGYYFAYGVMLAIFFLYYDYSLIPCSIAHSFFNILILSI